MRIGSDTALESQERIAQHYIGASISLAGDRLDSSLSLAG